MFDPVKLSAVKEAQAQWERAFQERYPTLKPAHTRSGIPLKPIYSPADLEGMDYLRDVGLSGSYPFVRGVYPGMYRVMNWGIRQLHCYGLPEHTNARWKKFFAEGMEGIGGGRMVHFISDMPGNVGLDPDHPLAQGHIGFEGVTLYSLEDYERLFDGVPMDQTSISQVAFGNSNVHLALLLAAAEKQDVPPSRLNGVCHNNPFDGLLCLPGFGIFPPRPCLRQILDVIRFCTKNMPRWDTYDAAGQAFREVGLNAIDELAYSFAEAMAVAWEGIRLGLPIDDFLHGITFNWSVYNDFFEEIAKFRAARRMWAKIARERLGAQNPRNWTMRCHAITAGSTLTAQQPLNNIVRATIEAMSAILGGTMTLSITSYDEGLCIPTEESALLSVRTHQIIFHETGMTNVVDPLGGSYFVEALTNRLEEETWRLLDRIEGMGGWVACIEKGFLQNEIAQATLRHARAIQSGERVVVGLNKYRMEEKQVFQRFPYDPEVATTAIDRVNRLKRRRDNNRVWECLEEVRRAAQTPDAEVMPHLLEAARAYATLGEMSGVLREVYGEHHEPAYLPA